MISYIAVSFTYWGRGGTITAAKRQLSKAGGDTRNMLVYRIDSPDAAADKPYVDAMGSIVSAAGSKFQLIHATRKGQVIDHTEVKE